MMRYEDSRTLDASKASATTNFLFTSLGSASRLLLAMLLTFCASAVAQTEDTSEVDAEMVMEEITVTSRKREERLIDVPDQITVFTAAQIEDAGIKNVYDAALLTPAVYFSGDWSPTVNTFTIRGISNNPNGDAPIAFVVDDVVYGNSFLIAQDLFDIEQIEILKGPQGALYGKGSTAGAVSVRTRMPTNDLDARAMLRVGNGDELRFKGSVSGALVPDKVLYSVSALASDFDGVIYNVYHNVPVDYREQQSIRGRLVFTPTDDLSIDVRAMYYDADHAGTRWRATNVPPTLPIIKEGIQEDYLTTGSTNVKDYSAVINWDLGFANLTSITDYQEIDAPRTVDLDFTEWSFIEAAIDPEDAEIFTQEFRLTSNSDGRFRWLLGAFYQDQDRYREIAAWLNVTGAPYDPAQKNLVQILQAPNQLSNTVTAIFGQVGYDITDRIELTVGLRYDSDDRKDILANLQETFSDTQPKVTLSYKPVDNWMVYGTYSEGFRSGGFNSSAIFGKRFEQEELKNYEAGFKGQAMGGMLDLAGAVYMMDFKNQQFFLFADGQQALVNAEKSEIRGIELEMHTRPIEGLDIGLGGNWLDTELKELGDFPGPVVGDQVNGNELPFAPDYTLNASVQYETAEFGNGLSLIARADWVRYGQIWWTILNEKEEGQSPYNLLNLRLSLLKGNWRLTGFIENASDTKYDVFCFSNQFISSPFGVDACYDGTPKRYGIELSVMY